LLHQSKLSQQAFFTIVSLAIWTAAAINLREFMAQVIAYLKIAVPLASIVFISGVPRDSSPASSFLEQRSRGPADGFNVREA